jgi:microcystin-dependent protein
MDAFIGEIRPFAFGFQPSGWIQCNGQILNLMQYQALGSLLGNTFGGNLQQNTFGVPNLQGVAVMGLGTGTPPPLTPRTFAAYDGAESVTLTGSTMPAHTHALNVATPTQAQATTMTGTPSTATIPAREMTALVTYSNVPTGVVPMSPASLSPCGGTASGTSAPHENRQPYLAFNYCICWDGVYPDFP